MKLFQPMVASGGTHWHLWLCMVSLTLGLGEGPRLSVVTMSLSVLGGHWKVYQGYHVRIFLG